MTINILSPHIDDAAFCLTNTIANCIKNGLEIKLINCFTVTKWTCVFVSHDVAEVSQLRKNEDAAFNTLFNNAIAITNLGLLDAPLRHGYVWQTEPLQPDEWELFAVIKNYIQANASGFIFCPLSIGFHIDHSIVREAAIHLFHNYKIIFYEDLPYAKRISAEELNKHIQDLCKILGVQLSSLIVPVATGLVEKGTAIKCYQSQLNDDIYQEITAYEKLIEGERIWGDKEVLQQLNSFLH